MFITSLKILFISLRLYFTGLQIECLRKKADNEISCDNISSYSASKTLMNLEKKITKFRFLEKQIISHRNQQQKHY